MKTVTKSFSNGSVVTKSDLPPVHTTLRTHLFSKTASLNATGTEFINPKGDNAPVVRKHFTAPGGVEGYLRVDKAICEGLFGNGWSIALDLYVDGTVTSNEYLLSAYHTSTAQFAIQIYTSNRLIIKWGKTGDGLAVSTAESGKHLSLLFQSSNNTIRTKMINRTDKTETDGNDYTYTESSPPNADLLVFHRLTANASSFIKLSNLRVWHTKQSFKNMTNPAYTTGCVLHLPLERNLFDLSGNNYHAEEVGNITTKSSVENNNGLHSYNLNNGFDRYQKDGDTEIIDVPYKNGIPITDSIDGYTKISSHPAGQNNMAWFFVDIPELDKSDPIFNATCRASEFYDSDNPTFWHSSELKAEVLNDYLEDSSIFIANTDTKSQDLLVYEDEGAETILARIDRWIKTIGRRGL